MIPPDPQTKSNNQQTPQNAQGLPPTQIMGRLSRPKLLRWGIAAFAIAGASMIGWRLFLASSSFSIANPIAREEIRVNLETVQAATVEESSEYIGSLTPLRSQILQPQTSGTIAKVLVNPGDKVSAGMAIMQIDPQGSLPVSSLQNVSTSKQPSPQLSFTNLSNSNNPDPQLATISVLEAEQASRQADVRFYQRELNKYAKLAEQGAVSQQTRNDYASKLNRAQTALADIKSRIKSQKRVQNQVSKRSTPLSKPYKITAPFPGNIQSMAAKVGDIVNPASELATIAQTSSLELQLYVPVTRLAQLRKGMPIQILDDVGKIVGTSRIVSIAARKRHSQDSILVTAIYNNSQPKLEAPGFTRTRIVWKSYPGATIPEDAVTKISRQAFVYVAELQGNKAIARQKEIKLGSITGDNYQVIAGLQPGEKIITSNLARLRDGDWIIPISSAPQKNK